MSELSEMTSSLATRPSDPMEITLRRSEDYSQLVNEQNPEHAPTLLVRSNQAGQVPQTPPRSTLQGSLESSPGQQTVSRNEIINLSDQVSSIDRRLTSSINQVRDSVINFQAEVEEKFQQVNENFQEVKENFREILSLLRGIRSCECGITPS